MRKILYCLFLSLLFMSCVKDIDFDQIDDLTLTPSFSAALVNATLSQDDLVLNGIELPLPIEQTSYFSVFDNSTVRDDLTRVVFNFEVFNQFDREFIIGLEFLDEAFVPTYITSLNVSANDMNFTQEEDILIANYPTFVNSRNIRVTVTLLPSDDGSIIDVNEPATFRFESGGTFYFTVD